MSSKILTKLPLQHLNWTSTSKSWLNFNFKILTKPCAQSLNRSLALWPSSAFKSATNCCQHDPHHQHQQQKQPEQALHARVTSIKSTKRQWVSEWVSYWQGLPMIGLGSDNKRCRNTSRFSYFCLLASSLFFLFCWESELGIIAAKV